MSKPTDTEKDMPTDRAIDVLRDCLNRLTCRAHSVEALRNIDSDPLVIRIRKVIEAASAPNKDARKCAATVGLLPCGRRAGGEVHRNGAHPDYHKFTVAAPSESAPAEELWAWQCKTHGTGTGGFETAAEAGGAAETRHHREGCDIRVYPITAAPADPQPEAPSVPEMESE